MKGSLKDGKGKNFMSFKAFFDTNIFAYAFDRSNPEKKEKARALISQWMPFGNMVISTQVLQELFVVLTRKLKPGLSTSEAEEVLKSLLPLEVKIIDPEMIFQAIQILKEHSISFWDALIVAAAVSSRCKVVFTEDLNPGQIIADVRIENPFG